MMSEQGYTKKFAAGITIASATIGPIFPPSISLIIFASAAEVSAVRVLLAGVVPALVLTVVFRHSKNTPRRHWWKLRNRSE